MKSKLTKMYRSLCKKIQKIAWYCTTKPCPQCKGTGFVIGSLNNPAWTIHGKFLHQRNVCGICHSFGRVPRFERKPKFDLEALKTVKYNREESRRMPYLK